MDHSYSNFEEKSLAALRADSQGRRIHARVQAVCNYSMTAELAKGHLLSEQQVIEGFANGFNSILAMLAQNMAPHVATQCLALTNAYFQSDHATYVGSLEASGVVIKAAH